ncbi:MAG: hypothetical protein ABI439_07505 [Rhodospirillales bacterium]
MQALHPRPELHQFCPVCPDRPLLQPLGFQIPCLFTMIEARCPTCHRDFLVQRSRSSAPGDWMMLEPQTGKVHSSLPGEWLERMLDWAWRSKHDRPVSIETITRRPVRRPLVANCIEYYYGHCLGLLYDLPNVLAANPDRDVIAIVQRPIAWMVPDGVAELWIVDTPLSEGHAFSSALASELKRRITAFDECGIDGSSITGSVDISKLTRIKPFDWRAEESLGTPVVTFVIREDRCWLYRARRTPEAEIPLRQAQIMDLLAQGLLHYIPGIDLAVVGFGSAGKFSPSVQDMRVARGQRPDEIAWTKRYARSHIVLGVHGSNMLLPAAHAAASIEIVPLEKFVNMANAYEFISHEPPVDAVRHHHFMPMSITLTEVATLISATLHFVRASAFTQQTKFADQAIRARLHAQYSDVLRFPEPIIIEG